MRRYLRTALLAATMNLLAGQTMAAEIGKYSANWEIRLGGGAFDVGPFSRQVFSGGIINAEMLAPSPGFLAGLGSPRPYLGTDISLSNQAIHTFYTGLNWEAHLTDRFYAGFSLGGSVNTSKTTTQPGGATKRLGSQVLFHLQASAGYDLTDSITAQVFLNHFSNANLGSSNHGLESVGARIGYRF